MVTVEEDIEQAPAFSQRLEDIIVRKAPFTLSEAADREKLLIAYWALTLDLDKSILALMRNKFYGGAFALLRPVVDASRAHRAGTQEAVNTASETSAGTNPADDSNPENRPLAPAPYAVAVGTAALGDPV